jgi:uncharacterized damage-inducible protein DinB
VDQKEILHGYLRNRRADLVGKLDGLSEYDARRPLTSSGTNVLGVIKHVASVELGYFTDTFGRPTGRVLPWFAEGAEPDLDFWAPPEETREDVLELHRFSADASDAVIEELPLDAPGQVPWWPEERRAVTLQQILVHMLVETSRHCGHVDIVRELLDGEIGQRAGDRMVDHRDVDAWSAHRARVQAAAEEAGRRYD